MTEEINRDEGEKPKGPPSYPEPKLLPDRCLTNEEGGFVFQHQIEDLEIRWTEAGVPYLACANCGLSYTRLGEQIIVMFSAIKAKYAEAAPLVILPGSGGLSLN